MKHSQHSRGWRDINPRAAAPRYEAIRERVASFACHLLVVMFVYAIVVILVK